MVTIPADPARGRSSRHPRRPGGVVRLTCSLLAVGLIAGALVSRGRRAELLRELDSLLVSSDLQEAAPHVRQDLRRESDPVRVRLGVVRGILALSLDPRPMSALGPRRAMELAARELDRLDLALDLTKSAVAERPLWWQGWMLKGTVTYLRWARTGDPRLFTEQEVWEGPLRTAMSLAPNYLEPRQMLAGALLEVWPALSEDGQREALEVVQDAFKDEATFARLIRGWLRVAPPEVVSLAIPETPAAWSAVLRSLAAAADWDEYRPAFLRHRQALRQSVEMELQRGEDRLRGGDPAGARGALLRVLELAPPEREFASAVDRALTLLPAGAPDRSRSRPVGSWLRVALDSFAEGAPILSPAATGRLSLLAGDLPGSTAALAELAAGNLVAAEMLERRNEAINTEPWAAYCVAKARVLLERDDRAGAARMLETAHGSWREAPPGRALRRRIEGGVGGRGPGPDPNPDLVWRGTEWRWLDREAFLWLDVSRPATGLRIEVDQAPRQGAVVGVYVGRELAGIEVAVTGESVLVPYPVGSGVHRLELRSLTGGRISPGDVHLLVPSTEVGSSDREG